MSSTPATKTTKSAPSLGVPPYVTELNANDVLMGRGSPSAEYEGNLRLRKLVQTRRTEYLACPHRLDKQRIVQEIVDQVVHRRGGRFLVRIATAAEAEQFHVPPRTQAWKVMDPSSHQLFGKIKQLMRDMGPEIQQKRKIRRMEKRRTEKRGENSSQVPPPQSPFSVPSAITYGNLLQFRKDKQDKQMEELSSLCQEEQEEEDSSGEKEDIMFESTTTLSSSQEPTATTRPAATPALDPALVIQILGLVLQQQQQQQRTPLPPMIDNESSNLQQSLWTALQVLSLLGATGGVGQSPPPNDDSSSTVLWQQQDPQLLMKLLAHMLSLNSSHRHQG
eukprot:scaffold2246_cov162-Amphora_coffeaeformis.AAC.34